MSIIKEVSSEDWVKADKITEIIKSVNRLETATIEPEEYGTFIPSDGKILIDLGFLETLIKDLQSTIAAQNARIETLETLLDGMERHNDEGCEGETEGHAIFIRGPFT